MTEISAWHLDIETAQKEVQACFAKWQELTNRIQKIVDGHEGYAPDAFEASLEELMAEYKRAANAVVARLGIMAQIKAGKMQFSVEGPDQTTG